MKRMIYTCYVIVMLFSDLVYWHWTAGTKAAVPHSSGVQQLMRTAVASK